MDLKLTIIIKAKNNKIKIIMKLILMNKMNQNYRYSSKISVTIMEKGMRAMDLITVMIAKINKSTKDHSLQIEKAKIYKIRI